MNNGTRDQGGYAKWLTVERMLELLATLPKGWSIGCNRVNNLAIYDENLEQVGHIDMLLEGEIDLYEVAPK